MKRFILSIALVVLPLLGISQNHLTFMGVEIDGTMTSFVEKMKTKGFTFIERIDDVTIMKGTFTNKPVDLYISQTPVTKKVSRVTVYYEKDETWSSIKYDYQKLVEAYKEKYTLDKEFHFFSKPYYEGDGYEMQAVKLEKCHYVAFFKTESGSTIFVKISEFKQITITYEDLLNTQLRKQESKDAVKNDI